jgi:hypothetical protein
MTFAGVLLGVSGSAWADDFYAIIANSTGDRNPRASLEVSEDTLTLVRGTDVVFTVWDSNGVFITEFTQQSNTDRGFVSSASATPPNDNLFALSAGQPALVRATLPGGTNRYAVLRETLGKSNIILGVQAFLNPDNTFAAAGMIFPVTLGAFSRATLLVANVSGVDVGVDVFVGTKGADGTGKYRIDRVKNNGIGILEITDPADAQSHLVLSSTGNIVAQLVIDNTKSTVTEVTLVPIH